MIAERITRLVNGTLPWPFIDPEKALPWIEQKTGLSMAESQIAAIRLSLLSKVLVITGGPGVGKTTIVNSILRILAAKGVNLLLCAPTGRAAKRMTEATGFEAKTIHRMLEYNFQKGGFQRNEENPLVCDALIVDEAHSSQSGSAAQKLRRRKDEVTDGGYAAQVLSNGSETAEGFFVVPKVVESSKEKLITTPLG